MGCHLWRTHTHPPPLFFEAATGGNLVTPWKAEQRIQANLFKSKSKLFDFYSQHSLAEFRGFFFSSSSFVASVRSFLWKYISSTLVPAIRQRQHVTYTRDGDLDTVYTGWTRPLTPLVRMLNPNFTSQPANTLSETHTHPHTPKSTPSS